MMRQEVYPSFCLDSALEILDSYYRGDRICCYLHPQSRDEQLKEISVNFSKKRYGLTRVELYAWDFKGLDLRKPIHSDGMSTEDVQTIIDMFCDDRGFATKGLLKRRWGVDL